MGPIQKILEKVRFFLKKSEREELKKDLLNTEYPFIRVTENKGYQAFLK